MKRIVIIFLLIPAMLFSCKKESNIPDELLLDTGVEGTQQQVWLSTHNPGTNDHGFLLNITEAQYHSPTHSLTISRTRLSADSLAAVGQQYSSVMPAGEDLTFSAWVKGVNLTGNGASLMIRCDDGQGNIIQASPQLAAPIKGTFDWTEYSVSLSDVSSDVRNILVWLVYLENTTGTVYFDDVSLTHNK